MDPETDGIQNVIPDLGIVVIQAGKIPDSVPGFVTKGVSHGTAPAKVYAPVPAAVRGSVQIFADILKGKEIASCMVEYSIDDYPDSCCMAVGYKGPEVFGGSQTPVNSAEITGVIAMGGRLEKRSDIKGRNIQVFYVWNPGIQLRKSSSRFALLQTVRSGGGVFLKICRKWILSGNPGHSQGVHVVKNGIFIPGAHGNFLRSCESFAPGF